MIALYKRLSLADGDIGERGKEESNSIEHQGDFLNAFVLSKREFEGMKTVDYADDGYTGINFDRPAFKKMMEGVRRGDIDTIIVKDISRFGRDYIGVGEYLEQIFPLLGVRFIAVNNNYDSSNYKGLGLNLDMSVNNLVNTMYSRDTGKKLHCSNEVRWKKGYSTASSAPFGYVFDPHCKGRFVIDKGAAEIVRLIFDLALKGRNTTMIAYELNERGIPIPSEYNRINKIAGKKRQYTLTPDKIWNSAKVWRIIRSYEYTGAMVLGKHRVMMSGTDIVRAMPKDKQYITENTHEAIITHDEWEKAQLVIRSSSQKAYKERNDFALKKKIRCGHCMRAMHYSFRGAAPKVWCREGKDMPKHSKCPKSQYSISEIESKVSNCVHMLIRLIVLLENSISEYEKNRVNGIKRYEAIRQHIERQLFEIAEEKLRLYEEYACKNINLSTYRRKKGNLNNKEAYLNAINTPNSIQSEAHINISDDIKCMVKAAEKYLAETGLTKEMADIFIQNVYVHEGKRLEICYVHEEELFKCMEYFHIIIPKRDIYKLKNA